MAILQSGCIFENVGPIYEPMANAHDQIISSISTTWGRKRVYMCNFCNFCRWPSFMSKYGHFDNRTVSRKPLPLQRKLAGTRPPGVENIYVQLRKQSLCFLLSLYQNRHADFELAYRFCFLVLFLRAAAVATAVLTSIELFSNPLYRDISNILNVHLTYLRRFCSRDTGISTRYQGQRHSQYR